MRNTPAPSIHFIAKWNFTGGKTVAPYLAAVGGVVFSSSNLPPGDTSQVNFTSGAELGVQWFRHERNSLDFAVKIYHLSNASIGNHESRHQRRGAVHGGIHVAVKISN